MFKVGFSIVSYVCNAFYLRVKVMKVIQSIIFSKGLDISLR